MDAASVWNVTDESRLMGLTTEPGAVISGTVTVDGVEVDVSAGGSWTGEIIVTPAAPAAVTESGTASDNPPERPADLGPGEEPPGGFGGID